MNIIQAREAAMAGKIFKIVDGDMSDGYHTFDELYEHRHGRRGLLKYGRGSSVVRVPK